jgi:hypothetical protein
MSLEAPSLTTAIERGHGQRRFVRFLTVLLGKAPANLFLLQQAPTV